MKVEVTLQFEVPDDSTAEVVIPILRERINNFDYINELVQWTLINNPEKSVIAKDLKLEHLEQSISAFKELLQPKSEDRCIEADNLLSQHHRNARETYYKNL